MAKISIGKNFLVALAILGSGSGLRAGELGPAKLRMDFIIGGKHAPWYVALEKGFYAKRGLKATIHASTGSADTVRTLAAGGADFGFADLSTTIVARSAGTPVQAVAQLGYLPATVVWRAETNIKTLKDLEGKTYTNHPGQSLWFLMPAFCRINKLDCKSMRMQEMAGSVQPAALISKKVEFVLMYRASNDEVTELAAVKRRINLRRFFMRDTGLDIYDSGLIARDSDVEKRPDFVRAYVEGTLEGLRYARDHRDEALKILLKHKPELDIPLTTLQLRNALTEVFLPQDPAQNGLGAMKAAVIEKTVRVINEYFDIKRRVTPKEVYTNQFTQL